MARPRQLGHSIYMQTLNELLAAGLMSELSYVSPDEQAEMIDREAFLLSCESDELADAADFIALAATQGQ